MKYCPFPEIGEAYYEECLPNGLRIRIVPKKGFGKKHAFLAVDFGAIDTHFTLEGKEHRVPDGIAHYLEHKMFDLPEENAMNLFARWGGSPNAFTSYDMTAYYMTCTEHFEENLRLLLHMVMTPCFTPESVEKERGIIAQEIQMYEDSAHSRVGEELFRCLYAQNPVRVPIVGTVESIGTITAQMLYDCYDAFYRPGNMILCVVGDVDGAQVINIAAEEAGTQTTERPLPVRHYGKEDCLRPARGEARLEMEVSMPTFAIGFPCRGERGETLLRREIAGDLAAEILVGESSPLYQRLYEAGLIDNDFYAGYEQIKEVGLLSMGGDSRDPHGVLQAILEEVRRIEAQGVEEKLFYRLKKSALGRRMRDLDSFQSICYRLCAYGFDGIDYFRFPEAYAAVSLEEVQTLLSQLIRPERSALAVIVPKKKGA